MDKELQARAEDFLVDTFKAANKHGLFIKRMKVKGENIILTVLDTKNSYEFNITVYNDLI